MKDSDKLIGLLEAIHENGTIWLVLGSLISADSLVDIKSCEENLEVANSFLGVIDSCTNIPEKDRQTYKEHLEKAKDIISRDLEEFKNNKEGN
jgi:hypothetical protein